jgi:hypothetical protein
MQVFKVCVFVPLFYSGYISKMVGTNVVNNVPCGRFSKSNHTGTIPSCKETPKTSPVSSLQQCHPKEYRVTLSNDNCNRSIITKVWNLYGKNSKPQIERAVLNLQMCLGQCTTSTAPRQSHFESREEAEKGADNRKCNCCSPVQKKTKRYSVACTNSVGQTNTKMFQVESAMKCECRPCMKLVHG